MDVEVASFWLADDRLAGSRLAVANAELRFPVIEAALTRIGRPVLLGIRAENIDVVQRILELTGRDESLIEYVTDRPGHDRRYAIDATKIKNALGWLTVPDMMIGVEDDLIAFADRIRGVREYTYGDTLRHVQLLRTSLFRPAPRDRPAPFH